MARCSEMIRSKSKSETRVQFYSDEDRNEGCRGNYESDPVSDLISQSSRTNNLPDLLESSYDRFLLGLLVTGLTAHGLFPEGKAGAAFVVSWLGTVAVVVRG